jgi:outer membrane receptor protein involved in Fe transport
MLRNNYSQGDSVVIRTKDIVILSGILLFLFCCVSFASAQEPAAATLTGRLTDVNGAVIPGVKVTAVNNATTISRTTTANNDGVYVLTGLQPGQYDVKAQASGFADALVKSAVLLVGQTITIDIQLNVGSVTDQIDKFFGVEPLVNTESAVVDGVINSRSIENLPLNGRNFLELAFLIPGNSPAPNFDPTKTNVVGISSAGQLGRGGSVTIDGADNNDDVVGGSLQNISQDAVQEFQIATNRFSAEIGRSGSSVINIVTKSGTNEVHGSGSFFWRDRRLQGLPATFDRSTGETPPFDREQYSGAVGGPIKRDRAWWFGAFEYRNQDGAVLVGQRDTTTRTIKHTLAAAPLNDLLADLRSDWQVSSDDKLSFRYSLEREDDISVSNRQRALSSADHRNSSKNNYQSFLTSYDHIFSPTVINEFRFSENNFFNSIDPTTVGPQLTFPSLTDGAGFDVPQATKQNRLQFTDALTWVKGTHTLRFGGEVQHIDGEFDLGVFRQGRIEMVEDFPDFDRNGDGKVNDDDLLFAVTLRSGNPNSSLILPDSDNNHFNAFVQDDWRVRPNLTFNIGLRYELDTDVKNVSRVDQLNPIILPFLHGTRTRDKNNFAPRFGFNWSPDSGKLSIHGGYGIYYDRVTLEVQSLERGLDGRALPIVVRAGSVFFTDPNTGKFAPGSPTVSNPFTGFVLPGAGAAGINIIDNDLQNPMVQQFNIGFQREFGNDFVVKADYLHNLGTHFIIGRTIGTVFNPVVGGPDKVVNLESSVNTQYDGFLLSVEKRFARHYQFRASYTLSKAFNYANDDQIPFSNGPVDPTNVAREYGPTPNDQRHRFALSGVIELPHGFKVSPILTLASGVPMDILLPDASSRIPALQRNAGGRIFHTGAELNAFITRTHAVDVNGDPLPLVSNNAKFNDSFSSVDIRLSKEFKLGEHARIEPLVEAFNLFNVTNILGTSNVNYSGFSNVLIRDSNNKADPGFLKSSSFGQPVTTAGGVFGSGGPRAFQLAVRLTF